MPPTQSRRLFEAVAGEKRFLEFPGTDHNSPEFSDGRRMIREVMGFIRDAVGPPL